MGVVGGDSSSVRGGGGGVTGRSGDVLSPVRDLKNPAAVFIKLLSLLLELLAGLVVGVDTHSPLFIKAVEAGMSLIMLVMVSLLPPPLAIAAGLKTQNERRKSRKASSVLSFARRWAARVEGCTENVIFTAERIANAGTSFHKIEFLVEALHKNSRRTER